MIEKDLGDGLWLRSVRDDEDRARYAALNLAVNGEAQGAMAERLVRCHPSMFSADFRFVEDACSGEVVSTTCLIPWRLDFQGITLDVAMLEMVATLPAYRRRGLIRAQIEQFHQAVVERGYDLCLIEGIPHYYRQFGYSYAVNKGGYDALPTWNIPPAADSPGQYATREATLEDVPDLARLHEAENARLDLRILRQVDYWGYLLRHSGHEVRVVHDQAGQVRAYYMPEALADRPGARVLEAGAEGAAPAMAILRALCGQSAAEIRIHCPRTSTLAQVARGLGSMPATAYQWLLRIPNTPGLLAKLRPVIEARLAASIYAGLSGAVVLNLFTQAYELRFADGALVDIAELGFVDASMGADGGDLCLPRDAFVRLLMGYRDLDELHDAWPDIRIKRASRGLLDALFPRLNAFFSTPY